MVDITKDTKMKAIFAKNKSLIIFKFCDRVLSLEVKKPIIIGLVGKRKENRSVFQEIRQYVNHTPLVSRIV